MLDKYQENPGGCVWSFVAVRIGTVFMKPVYPDRVKPSAFRGRGQWCGRRLPGFCVTTNARAFPRPHFSPKDFEPCRGTSRQRCRSAQAISEGGGSRPGHAALRINACRPANGETRGRHGRFLAGSARHRSLLRRMTARRLRFEQAAWRLKLNCLLVETAEQPCPKN